MPTDIKQKRTTIIFDVDGTLLDSEKLYMKAWVQVGADYGYAICREALIETRAVSAPVAKKVFQKYCGEDFPYEQIQESRKAVVEALFAATPPEQLRKPHALETLRMLKAQGYTLAVASSTSYEGTRTHLRHAGLLDFFSVAVGGDMVENGKPAPDIFLKAARLSGAEPEQCVVVGDTPADVLGAAAAGIPVILIPDMVPVNAVTKEKSHCILSDLSEVLGVIPAMA